MQALLATMRDAEITYRCYLELRYKQVISQKTLDGGASTWSLMPQYWPMLMIGLATLTIAVGLLRRRLY
jgi:hypothetical protein